MTQKNKKTDLEAKISQTIKKTQADLANREPQRKVSRFSWLDSWGEQPVSSVKGLCWRLIWTILVIASLATIFILAGIIVVAAFRYAVHQIHPTNTGPTVITMLNFLQSGLIDVLIIILLLILPYYFGRGLRRKAKPARRAAIMKLFGINRLPNILDLWHGAIGYAVYTVASILVASIFFSLLPPEIAHKAQDIGFSSASNNLSQLIMIGFLVVIIGPIFEELIFRGYLLGRLQVLWGFWPAAIIVSTLFAIVHGQLNVGIVVFVMAIISSILRRKTGAIWSGIMLHMLTNALAFSLVFVGPMLK